MTLLHSRHVVRLAGALGVLCATAAVAQTPKTTQGATQGAEAIRIFAVDANGVGKPLGTISVVQTQHGVVLTPALSGLTPGLHGLHLHENASCEPKEHDGKPMAAGAAGGIYDPKVARQYGPPWGDGNLGNLPALFVDQQGKAEHPVLAPRLKMSDLPNHALVLKAGGDNYAEPSPGPGTERIACGVMN